MSKSEADEQIALAKWLNSAGVLWCHVPNEGKRRNGARLVAQGLRSGVPDVLIFTGSTAIELKRSTGKIGDVSANQARWLDDLERNGWNCTVAFGAEDAIRWLKSLGYRSTLDDN